MEEIIKEVNLSRESLDSPIGFFILFLNFIHLADNKNAKKYRQQPQK